MPTYSLLPTDENEFCCESCGCYFSSDEFCLDRDRCQDCCRCDDGYCDDCDNYESECTCSDTRSEDRAALVCPACGRGAVKGGAERPTCRCLSRIMVAHGGPSKKHPHFNPKRYFGVEIECYGGNTGRDALHERMCAISKELYGKVKVGSDPSIRGDNAMEIRIGPVCGDRGLKLLTRVLICLRARGFTVNPTCGLHVHHDILHTSRVLWNGKLRGVDDIATKVINLYGRYQAMVNLLCREHRRDGEYCRFTPQDWTGNHARCSGRYHAVNCEALDCHGTIEFRQHHATLVPASVVSWVLFTQLIVEKGANGHCKRIVRTHRHPPMWELWKRLIDPEDKRSVALRKFYIKQARYLAGAEYRDAPRFSKKKKDRYQKQAEEVGGRVGQRPTTPTTVT